jgi:hypothetical protein
MVLVEQNARLGPMLASYGYVLENGELVLQGRTADLMRNEAMKKGVSRGIEITNNFLSKSKALYFLL